MIGMMMMRMTAWYNDHDDSGDSDAGDDEDDDVDDDDVVDHGGDDGDDDDDGRDNGNHGFDEHVLVIQNLLKLLVVSFKRSCFLKKL